MRTWSEVVKWRCPLIMGAECLGEDCVFWGAEWKEGHVYGCLLRFLARYVAAKIGYSELLWPTGKKESGEVIIR